MESFNMTPCSDYREKIEALGFDFHGDYWREEAYYCFTPAEIERLEEATREAYRMYCEAAEYIISEKPDFMERMLQIPAEVCERICESWNRDELSLYGRFDFLLDEKGVPRILEFNADTPTSLLEASVIQWHCKSSYFPDYLGILLYLSGFQAILFSVYMPPTSSDTWLLPDNVVYSFNFIFCAINSLALQK